MKHNSRGPHVYSHEEIRHLRPLGRKKRKKGDPKSSYSLLHIWNPVWKPRKTPLQSNTRARNNPFSFPHPHPPSSFFYCFRATNNAPAKRQADRINEAGPGRRRESGNKATTAQRGAPRREGMRGGKANGTERGKARELRNNTEGGGFRRPHIQLHVCTTNNLNCL